MELLITEHAESLARQRHDGVHNFTLKNAHTPGLKRREMRAKALAIGAVNGVKAMQQDITCYAGDDLGVMIKLIVDIIKEDEELDYDHHSIYLNVLWVYYKEKRYEIKINKM